MNSDNKNKCHEDDDTNMVTALLATSAPVKHVTNYMDRTTAVLRTDRNRCSYGGLCTLRQVVMIVNVLNLCCIVIGTCLSVFTVLTTANPFHHPNAVMTIGTEIAVFWFILGINAIGIYGALNLNFYMVGACDAVYCVMRVLLVLKPHSMVGLVYYGICAWPHFFLVREVQRRLIMTHDERNHKILQDNHDDDEHCSV